MWARGADYYRDRLARVAKPPGRVLDLGCGPGQWAAAAEGAGFRVVACDRDIRHAAARLRPSHSLELARADGSRLPFADASFDLVLCHLVLPYVDQEACLAEMARVLRRGGTMTGTCHGPGYYLMQAVREAPRETRAAIRRLMVIGYTIAHRLGRLRRYRYEAYQTPGRIGSAIEALGLRVLGLEVGGHPLMPETRFLGLPVFFEFRARKD